MSGEVKFKTRGLKKDFSTPHTNDVVHRSIKLCPITKALISTPQMQRLKQLKQLGVSDNLYVCATHTRFAHSLGVMALAEDMLRGIAERQPRLGITEKEIVCVKIAGLLHDIGHGPYSHVFDGIFRKQLKKAEETGIWLGEKFDKSYTDAEGIKDALDGWKHEDASLMMIDAMLKELGLEIDEANLDAPLKQIADGIDAKCFGIWDRSAEPEWLAEDDLDDNSDDGADDDDEVPKPLPEELVLTSRDWIFIKECVTGGPLPPSGTSIDEFKKSGKGCGDVIGRPDTHYPHKEFLYTVVANSISGLDVDKMDYLARDVLHAHAGNFSDLLPKLSEKAFVAWGHCPNPSNCWMCKRDAQKKITEDKKGKHLMICYPDSMAQNIMSVFEKRFEEHHRVYTHGKTQAGNYMICDILLLADPFFRIHVTNDGKDLFSPPPDGEDAPEATSIPISRAMTDADTYLQLTDTVLDKIMNTDGPELRRARILINRMRSHEVYARIRVPYEGKEVEEKLWSMSEEDIVDRIVGLSKNCEHGMSGKELVKDDIIVEKKSIHHGMKEENPVKFVRFAPKEVHRQLLNSPKRLPTARELPETSYRKPDIFEQKAVRVYSRSQDNAKLKTIKNCYTNFIKDLQSEQYSAEFVEYTDPPPTPTNASIPPVTQSPKTKCDDDDSSSQSSKRQKRTLFDVVTKERKRSRE